MGIATSPLVVERITSPQKQPSNSLFKSFVQDVGRDNSSSTRSMSQGFHQGIFSFSDGFGRPTSSASQDDHHHQQQQHIAQQSRREKLRVQGFDPPPGHHPLVPMVGEDEPGGIYETATGAAAGNMLSEMFNFPTTTELLTSQIQGGYRLPTRPVGPTVGFGSVVGDWYNNSAANRQGMVLGDSFGGSIGDGKQLNADSAAVMQLFLMNPQQQQQQQQQQQRSPSPPSTPQAQLHHQTFAVPAGGPFDGASSFSTRMAGGVVEGQGLSLSLSSSLQQFEMAKAAHDRHQELRVRDGVLYFNSNNSSSGNNNNNNNNNNQNQNLQQQQQLQGQGQQSQSQHVHMGYGPVVNVLRNSKYSRAAQELLEEFCSVGRGQFKGSTIGRHQGSSSSNPNPNTAASTAGASTSVAGSSSSTKDVSALSPADRFEHQRNKSKLLSMLDEVDRRYNHYCEQMQMVVNSFDSVMGFGAATPYTALAQKAMSRHFRCLKDAIAAQLKHTCELLGEKETAGSGSRITRGETPRLRLLDQSLRQQRAFHQMGMMEQEAWRPQRGLPERSVNVLRAWLFEHFLHPYPSDADKHLLARQTGLSRNQVSNWFINARVRLWKPMVEEMYQQEAKEAEAAADQSSSQRDVDYSTTPAAAAAGGGGYNQPSQSPSSLQHQSQSQSQSQHLQQQQKRISETDAPERFLSDNTAGSTSVAAGGDVDPSNPIIDAQDLCGAHDDLYMEYGTAAGLGPAARMRLGTTGDVSLTLGLPCDPVMEKDAKAAACQVVRYERVPGPIVEVDEGDEPSEFWEPFSSLDKVEKDQLQSGTKGGVGKKRVDSYDVDFELFYKAITGGIVPPFPSSGPGQETHLPARESNWSVLRRKFISGTIYRVFSDSALVRDGDSHGNRVQLLSAESSTSPPYLSPSSISSDSSVSSKCCSDSPSISPSTCSSPSLTPSRVSSNLPDSFVSSSKPPLQISGSFKALKPCLQTVCSPSKGLARSISERRGSFSLKLPLNKDASLLSTAAMNESSAGVESMQEAIDRSNGSNYRSRDDSDSSNCTRAVSDIKSTSQCARDNSDDNADVNNHDHSQDNQLICNSIELVDSNLGSSNHTQLVVYRWPDFEKLTKFGREDLDSKAVLFFLTPITGIGSQLGRTLYLWIGSRVEEANGHSHLKSLQKDGVTEIDWKRVGCDFLAQMGLPKDLPIKVVKDQEPEEFLELFNSARFSNK